MRPFWKFGLYSLSFLSLSACITDRLVFSAPPQPALWSAYHSAHLEQDARADLTKWWERFDDPVLNALIEKMLEQSPDRRIAQARLQEARGLARARRSSLFPQIGASGSIGNENTGYYKDDFYNAGFDASFELDIFGANRNAVDAADARIQALEAEYNDVSLSLISEVARSYVEMREGHKQVVIAKKNLDIQAQTLELVRQQQQIGEAPQLDVERAETLVNTTRASISEFQRQADNARLRLTVLTGDLPVDMAQQFEGSEDRILVKDPLKPVVLAPAAVLSKRPDIQAASYYLMAQTHVADSAFATLFPTFDISAFYGFGQNVFFDQNTIWSLALGTAVSLIDFGRIEGQIDAARAQEKQAFEIYRKTILKAVVEVETALNDYARINDQYVSLFHAYENAQNALRLSNQLYNEGEISFIDVLDAQRTLNNSESALIAAEENRVQAVIRIYKSLGVY